MLPKHQEKEVIRVSAVLLSQLPNRHLRVVDNEARVTEPIDDPGHEAVVEEGAAVSRSLDWKARPTPGNTGVFWPRLV